ncbi:Crp/Fnr family transcriptional regulator [uncultured Acetobacteroides sp.]|uniref:Crp/Fnr family transcriptional regulator n=1 Tax=uncultured Acetobacteroides sp. TaxID=1760811 RepID=UPI0029F4A6C3|nr:Crp/Fnr family transcriptional regulator [uncultured Acetobacteroides sp.]
MDIERVKEAINTYVDLTAAEWDTLMGYLKVVSLKRNEYFLRAGQVCSSIALVGQGALVYYKLHESGKELTTDFALEGDWIADNRSRISQTPSLINIKAIEDCQLLTITNENLNKCYAQIPKLERLGRLLIEQAFVRIAQQSIDLQTLSSSQRYQKLLSEHPEVFQRIPLYHIANYLGIAPKSLSRIRGKG